MQLVNTQRNGDLSSLVSIYESAVRHEFLTEVDVSVSDDQHVDAGYFAQVVEVNITINTDTEIGDVRYKCDVDRGVSTDRMLTAVVRGQPDMLVVVTQLPTTNKGINVTLYTGGEAVERFVTTIYFFDEDEMELNITKEELV